MVITESISIKTKGYTDVIDITDKVQDKLHKTRLKNGIVTVFVAGSTAGITTIEYESGLAKDLKDAFDRIAPEDKNYHHHLRWGDDNGHSHVRSAMLGTSLTVPFSNGRLILGTWQQIILVDFDTRGRSREVILQFIGE
jgi:secondary thiamine-phosphate synthase enzyme